MNENAESGIADNVTETHAAAEAEGMESIVDEPTSLESIVDGEPGAPEKGAEPERQAEKRTPEDYEDYELAVSEDFPLPEENLKSFSAACREAGLSKEQAEKILDWHKGQYRETRDFAAQQEQQVLEGWNREILADADFGGLNYKATVADARRAFQAFDPDGELRAMLRDSKYYRHPTVIRAVARVGRAMGEHGFVGSNGEGTEDKPLEERMYPNMKF